MRGMRIRGKEEVEVVDMAYVALALLLVGREELALNFNCPFLCHKFDFGRLWCGEIVASVFFC